MKIMNGKRLNYISVKKEKTTVCFSGKPCNSLQAVSGVGHTDTTEKLR